jgi:hypothetical protein
MPSAVEAFRSRAREQRKREVTLLRLSRKGSPAQCLARGTGRRGLAPLDVDGAKGAAKGVELGEGGAVGPNAFESRPSHP